MDCVLDGAIRSQPAPVGGWQKMTAGSCCDSSKRLTSPSGTEVERRRQAADVARVRGRSGARAVDLVPVAGDSDGHERPGEGVIVTRTGSGEMEHDAVAVNGVVAGEQWDRPRRAARTGQIGRAHGW